MENKYYTVSEISEILKIHWQTVLRYIKSGKLEAVKLGKGYRISEKALDNFKNQNTTLKE